MNVIKNDTSKQIGLYDGSHRIITDKFQTLQKSISDINDNIETKFQDLQNIVKENTHTTERIEQEVIDNHCDLETIINMMLMIHPELFEVLENPSKDQAKIVVKADPSKLKIIPVRLQTELMCHDAVKVDGSLLEHCDDKYKTYSICWTACQNEPSAIAHVPEEHRYGIFKRLIDKDPCSLAIKIMGPKLSGEQREYAIEYCEVHNVFNYIPNLTFEEKKKLIERGPFAITHIPKPTVSLLEDPSPVMLECVAVSKSLDALPSCNTITDELISFAIKHWVKDEPLRLIMFLENYFRSYYTEEHIKQFIHSCPFTMWGQCEIMVPKMSKEITKMCKEKDKRYRKWCKSNCD